MFKTIFAAAIAALAISGGSTAQANTIVNGTFDNNSTGWTGTYGLRSLDPTIDTGSYLFFGAGGFHSISQTYTLSLSESSAADAGILSGVLSGDLFSWRSQNDIATVTATFEDSGHSALGSISISNSTNFTGFWGSNLTAGSAETFLEASAVIPQLTRFINFEVTGTRTGGTNNDAYADNLSFVLSVAQVPVTAALPLMAVALGAFGVAARRKRRSAHAPGPAATARWRGPNQRHHAPATRAPRPHHSNVPAGL